MARRRAAGAARSKRAQALAAAALLLALCVAVGDAQEGGEHTVPEVLTDQPHCKIPPSPVAGVLPAGVLPVPEADGATLSEGGGPSCTIALPQLGAGDTHLYQFGVVPGSEMSLIVVLRARGGTAVMDLFYPHEQGGPGDIGGAPDVTSVVTRDSAASSESWLAVAPDVLAGAPGLYTLRLRGDTGSPTVEVTVATPGPGVVLAAEASDALAKVAKRCCGPENEKSRFCADIAPAAFAPKHPWQADLCHTPPNLCDAQGRLLSLGLRDAGMICSSFPPELGALGDLERLDLSGNEFQAGAQDVAQVLAKSPLRELYLSNCQLGGHLDCGLITPKRRVLDLSSNFIGGPVDGCMMKAPVQELYLSRNELSGTLPKGPYDGSALVALALGNQRRPKGGLFGPIPPGLLAVPSLLFTNLANNNHTGQLPALPPQAAVFNASSNSLEGPLPPLPESLWVADLTANGFTGQLPPLNALPNLEAFLVGGNAFEGALPPLPPALAVLDASYNRLSGPLPPLPASLLVMDVGSNQGLSGDISGLDVGGLVELRLGNNSFTGGVPPSATKSRTLTMLSLRANKLGGALPSDWDVPVLEMLLLSDNQLTGTLPPSLARQPQLGTLRLEGNRLGGGLAGFASALPPGPEPRSQVFHLDVSRNALEGELPDELQRLAVFAPDEAFVMVTPAGPVPFNRALNVSENRLQGGWPGWLLSAVPQAKGACQCPISVRMSGGDMRLSCPRRAANVTDFYWQVASEQGYTCWDGARAVPLTDYLDSPNNAAALGDADGPIFGDSGPAAPKLTPGGSAGVVIAVVAVLTALAGVGYFWGYKRVWRERRAKRFERFEDSGAAPPAAHAGGGASADIAAVAAAVEGVTPRAG